MKDWLLRASRWDEAGTYLHEDYGGDIFNVSIRCSLPGWFQKAWFVTRARNQQQARNLHRNAHGQRIVFYDAIGPLLTGFVMAVEVDGLRVRYEVAGTYACRMKQAYYQPASPDVSMTVPELLQDMLTTSVPAAYVSPANFAANSQTVGDVFLQQIIQGDGVLPADMVAPLLDMSDDTYQRYEAWFQARPWQGMRPVYDAFHYAVREMTRDYADWVLTRADLTEADAALHSNVYDYRSEVVVKYGKYTGTSDYYPGDYYLHDDSVDFLAIGVSVGDMVTDLTLTDSLGTPVYMYIAAVTAHMLTGGSGYNWYDEEGTGHDYVIRLNKLGTITASATAASANLWDNVGVPFEAPELNQTQAQQKAQELLASLSSPIYQQPFTIGAPGIKDGKLGGVYPLWRLLYRPSYLSIIGAGPEDVGLAVNGIDLASRQGFYAVAADYNGDDGTVTITPNEPFPRLDVALKQLGITNGETVDSGRGQSIWQPFGSRLVRIMWNWNLGPPYPGWEDEMRAQGLIPDIGQDPRTIPGYDYKTNDYPNPPNKGGR